MPMMPEGAPEFARRFPEAAAIFDNLHMLHDNFDDILVRPDLYPTMAAKRAAILKVLPIYLHRAHGGSDAYQDFHEAAGGQRSRRARWSVRTRPRSQLPAGRAEVHESDTGCRRLYGAKHAPW
jgi:hypothetical protein